MMTSSPCFQLRSRVLEQCRGVALTRPVTLERCLQLAPGADARETERADDDGHGFPFAGQVAIRRQSVLLETIDKVLGSLEERTSGRDEYGPFSPSSRSFRREPLGFGTEKLHVAALTEPRRNNRSDDEQRGLDDKPPGIVSVDGPQRLVCCNRKHSPYVKATWTEHSPPGLAWRIGPRTPVKGAGILA